MKTTYLRRTLEYLLVFCIILEFNTIYLAFPIVKRVIQIMPALILLSLIIITTQKQSKNMLFFVCTYFIGAMLPILNIRSDAYIGYIKSYIVILPMLWIYLNKRKQAGKNSYLSIFLRYSNAMTVLGTISVVMWLLCSVFQIIPMTGLAPYAWSQNKFFVPSYYNIYFETQKIELFGELTRNTSFFNEGPMHNMTLCTALAIEYFIRPVKSNTRIILLSITILSTLTTTGQLFLLFLLSWHIFQKSISRYTMIMVVTVPIILFTIYYVFNIAMDFKTDVGYEGSVTMRSEDIKYCIEAGLQNPILGVGIVQNEDVVLWKGEILGRSNSLFTIFARGGLYVLILYMSALLIIPLKFCCKYRLKNWLLTILCYFGLFVITICYLQYLTLLFMAWGLSFLDMKKMR